ncbi:SRPBCC domain-containing protein [Streptomyces sp. VRA16 Mangrove soil]|uniref:SRPBCC domain-containing protein n=1 Tax=Streptomyces sp. VRA16 Mangrove soil TaxID=2817434 RepID=UPI001A9D2D53|nr:SRPBCC domain-containing protein [Streptomyces sp. VRA16 Mangrove soil]MBO1337215.1 SRPBCC domain-containing protein [Streptomyces sp. VRA16 Mangrove soil]
MPRQQVRAALQRGQRVDRARDLPGRLVRGRTAAGLWRFLVDTSTGEGHYDNADIGFPVGGSPVLADDAAFSFGTFGFPPPAAHVVEFQEPGERVPGRLSWTARQGGGPDEPLDVPHAWLVEDLPGGRTRVLTQESRCGKPAAALADERPAPMLNGHRAWFDGLVDAARR